MEEDAEEAAAREEEVDAIAPHAAGFILNPKGADAVKGAAVKRAGEAAVEAAAEAVEAAAEAAA